MFLIFLYFIGSCTRPEEYTPEEENTTPVYTELTPDEYQRKMDELINNSPQVTQTVFKSPILQAHASNIEENLKDFLEKTPAYDIEDWVDNWFIGTKDIKQGIKDIFDGNESVPVKGTEYTPKESVTVPFQYVFYGKERVVYKNATWEIITCQLTTTSAVSDSSKTGVVKYTRTNNLNQYTQFSYAISTTNIIQYFDSSMALRVNFKGLNSYTSGLTSDFVNSSTSGLTASHSAFFSGSSVNSLHQTNINSDNSVTVFNICSSSIGNSVPNHFSISTTVSNDYSFSQSLNSYYTTNKYWRLPNIYYNNNANTTINENNVSNYSEYGYTWNEINNSVEFDPDIFAGYLQNDILPSIRAEFDDIFSRFPDIDAEFDNYNGNYTDIVDLIQQLQPSEPPATSPAFTGDINVNVDVTFPEEFYKTYPPLTTEPAFVADNPDVDFALDSPFPLEILNSVENVFNIASNFIQDSGLMPMYIMCISLSLIALFLL